MSASDAQLFFSVKFVNLIGLKIVVIVLCLFFMQNFFCASLNAKIGKFYLAESLLTPAASGDTTLAALIKRLSSKGYLYGQAGIGNYPELPVQSWTYTVRWQFSFDNNIVVVEIQQLYYATKYTRLLNVSTGAWATDSWS